MKNLIICLLIAAQSIGLTVYGQDPELPVTGQTENESIEVYYFHYTRRCATCQAVEDESLKALKELYPAEVESGKVVFTSVNLEKESNEALAEKLQVAGQSLLIVKGGEQINLTNDAFKYARSNPEKLTAIIKEKVDQFL